MTRPTSLLAFAFALLGGCQGAPGEDGSHALAHRGAVAAYGDVELPREVPGTRFVRFADVPGLVEASARGDLDSMLEALEAGGVEGLVVARGRGEGALGELMSATASPPLRAIALDSGWTYFEVEPLLELEEVHRLALARAARQILAGAPKPPIGYFPAPLREVRSVEVMVMLRDRGEPRLWRSARAGSIASALVMAAEAARERWSERADALGGSLRERLPRLDVEVSLLIEDGTFLDRRPVFVAGSLDREHGAGYEQGGRWRYLLPARVRELGAEAEERAFPALFSENSLPEGAFERSDLRLYRLRVHRLATSPAPVVAP